ncbi:hypothetical protein HDU76_008581 [Blyttiomyces sp. JEL0837]|nr:hypothetical protein HDU76_008581 [Blyttiomyces sp. JEL0837]
MTPSMSRTMIVTVVIWVVTMTMKALMIVPKWIELYDRVEEKTPSDNDMDMVFEKPVMGKSGHLSLPSKQRTQYTDAVNTSNHLLNEPDWIVPHVAMAQAGTIPESKYRTNITVASHLVYAIGDYYANSMMQDALMEMAINETNEDPEILPYTFVKMARYNAFDPDQTDSYPFIDSGGYAINTAIEIAQSKATAVVGEFFSKTAIYSSEVFSYFQIPICSPTASAYALSNDAVYPFYFRTAITTMAAAKGFVTLLKHWDIKRVALIIGFDSLSRGTAKIAEKTILEANIKVLTKVSLSSTEAESNGYAQIYRTLLAVDARYILLFADRVTTPDFFYGARNHSLISSKHVWLGMNDVSIIPSSISMTEASESALGYVPVTGFIPSDNTAVQADFDRRFNQNIVANPRLASILADSSVNPYIYTNTYDCTKTILRGLHQLLKQNNYSPEMLANGSLNPLLHRSAFADTGYPGVFVNPMKIDNYGNIELPVVYANSNFSSDDVMSNAFGITDITVSEFIPLDNKPIFFGGSNVPPPDGPVLQTLSIAPSSVAGVIIIVMSAIGLLFSEAMVTVSWGHCCLRIRDCKKFSSLHSCISSSQPIFIDLARLDHEHYGVTIAYLGYATEFATATFSEAAFLPGLAMASAICVVINALTQFLMTPSVTTIMIITVIIWVVTMTMKVLMIVPKWIELYDRDEEKPSSSFDGVFDQPVLGSGMISLPSKQRTQYSDHTVNTVNASDNSLATASNHWIVPYIIMGSACIRCSRGNSLVWSDWKEAGIIVLSHSGVVWIVFDYDDGSEAAIVSKNDVLDGTDRNVRLEMPNDGVQKFVALLEFDTTQKMEQFCEKWKKLNKYGK